MNIVLNRMIMLALLLAVVVVVTRGGLSIFRAGGRRFVLTRGLFCGFRRNASACAVCCWASR